MLSTSSVLGKLIFAVDEAFIQANIVIERIKYLSTANKFKAEGKGKERYETDFFAKFILCSNNEDTFLKIDEEEIRFWVRKLPPLENDNTNLLKELKSEIPAFLFFLINRHLSTACKSRMWFTKEQLMTDALRIAIEKSKSQLEQELETIIKDKMEELMTDIYNAYGEKYLKLEFTNKDLIDILKESGIKANNTELNTL